MRTVRVATIPDLLKAMRDGDANVVVDVRLKNRVVSFDWMNQNHPNGDRLRIGSNLTCANLQGITFAGSQVEILGKSNVYLKNFSAQSAYTFNTGAYFEARRAGGGVRSLHIGESKNVYIGYARCGWADDESLSVVDSSDVKIDHCIIENGRVPPDPDPATGQIPPGLVGMLWSKGILAVRCTNLTIRHTQFKNLTIRYPDLYDITGFVFERNLISRHSWQGVNWNRVQGTIAYNRWYITDPVQVRVAYSQPWVMMDKVDLLCRGNMIDDVPAVDRHLMIAPR